MAFQPIVDVARRRVFAYEALVRGAAQESALEMLARVTEESIYAFDQSCRNKAIALASRLGIAQQGALLSVNFMPGAVYSPAACMQQTLRAAEANAFPLSSLMFEITEMEEIRDTTRLQAIASEYRRHGVTLALDDFGAGYSGLNLLADLDVNVLKLDGGLIRGIDRRPRAAEMVRSTAAMCRRLGVQIIGECVETRAEYDILRDCGINLMQGYFFAKPSFESLPQITWPEDRLTRNSIKSIDLGIAHDLALSLSSVA